MSYSRLSKYAHQNQEPTPNLTSIQWAFPPGPRLVMGLLQLLLLVANCSVVIQPVLGIPSSALVANDQQQPFGPAEDSQMVPNQETVDRLIGAAGDRSLSQWRQGNGVWTRPTFVVGPSSQVLNRRSIGEILEDLAASGKLDQQESDRPLQTDDMGHLYYHFYAPSSNLARQTRAFKPRLMSTARGFGKRSTGPAIMISDEDSNSKLQHQQQQIGRSKYDGWFDLALTRWPSVAKLINEKFIDNNG